MVGTLITYCNILVDDEYGYIVMVSANDLLAETIEDVIILRDKEHYPVNGTTLKQKLDIMQTDLASLLLLPYDPDSLEASYSFDNTMLYIFIKKSIYSAYDEYLKFSVLGTRLPIQVVDENSYIDIPEKDIELFIKYVIDETSQILGKQTPLSVLTSIKELEGEILQ